MTAEKQLPLFIGLENELITFNKASTQRTSFDLLFDQFHDFLRNRGVHTFNISPTSIRTSDGLGFYVDGNEVEINTPPIELTAGFASRLVDTLLFAREQLVSFANETGYVHTGYSMHLNVSRPAHYMLSNFLPVLSLLGTTPASRGVSSREPKYGRRKEFLADSINNEPQLRALALLSGAAALYEQRFGRGPGDYYTDERRASSRDRNSIFPVEHRNAHTGAVLMQDYLESMHRDLQEMLSVIATPAERAELADIVSGRIPIEQDKLVSYHSFVRSGSLTAGGVYQPRVGEGLPAVIISSESPRELPREAMLWGQLPQLMSLPHMELSRGIDAIRWDRLNFWLVDDRTDERIHVAEADSVSAVYDFLEKVHASSQGVGMVEGFETLCTRTRPLSSAHAAPAMTEGAPQSLEESIPGFDQFAAALRVYAEAASIIADPPRRRASPNDIEARVRELSEQRQARPNYGLFHTEEFETCAPELTERDMIFSIPEPYNFITPTPNEVPISEISSILSEPNLLRDFNSLRVDISRAMERYRSLSSQFSSGSILSPPMEESEMHLYARRRSTAAAAE